MSKEWLEVPLNITDKIGQFAIWAGTRVIVATPALLIYGWKQIARLNLHLAEIAERSYSKVLIVFDSLPYGGMEGTKLIEVEAKTISQAIEPIIDLIAAIAEKELMIIGEKGTGKSTLAQYLGYSLGGHIKVYEPEGTPEDWNGLEVIGKGEDWDAINEAMQADLEHISSQMKRRRERGDAALAGSDRVIIGEEYPEIAAKCNASEEWLDRHARRGRKALVRLILLSQFDRIAAWGMEGKSDLLDCFYRLRLGRKAINHAKSLKRLDLVEWLASSRSHALLDNDPVILPDYREMVRVIQSFQRGYTQLPPSCQPPSNRLPDSETRRTAESEFQPSEGLQKENSDPQKSSGNQGFQPSEGTWESQWESRFWEVWQALQAEKSNYWIGGNVFDITGGTSYQRLCERLDTVRAQLGKQG
jgi:hypothetical protein